MQICPMCCQGAAAKRVPWATIGTVKGTAEPCCACKGPIAPEEPLEECEYPAAQVLRFHGLCYKYWNEEREAI
jgi:hypothetical protein